MLKFETTKQVEIDGVVFNVRPIGAKTELLLQRQQKELAPIVRKIEDGVVLFFITLLI